MQVIYAPQRLEKRFAFSIFLAGTIDMGNSVDWQSKVCDLLKNHNVSLYNPRRPDWDNSIRQTVEDPRFAEQVNWELDQLTNVDLIIMYLAKDSISPISLMELGMFAPMKRIVVYCDANFHRRGNVEVVCNRYKIPLFSDEEVFFNKLVSSLSFYEK